MSSEKEGRRIEIKRKAQRYDAMMGKGFRKGLNQPPRTYSQRPDPKEWGKKTKQLRGNWRGKK